MTPTGSTAPADLALGTFTDHDVPWVLDLDELTWLRGAGPRRAAARAEVPELIRPRRIPPIGRVLSTVRHLGPALGLWALGARRKGGSESRADLSRRLRIAAEHLGPTYIKLAQIISSGEGIFPRELVEETKKCRDQVPPQPFEDVLAVVTEDLGRPLFEVFRTFDREPIAAASIAQVHAAELLTGEKVVVKVQRRTVGERVKNDLRVMATIAPRLVGRIPVSALANPPALVEVFAETITEELDFRLEAENMLDVAHILAQLEQRDWVVPRPHPTLVTPRVLVMERLDGFAFDDVAGMHAAGVDTEAVVRTGMIAFMEGAFLHGTFHGDLHGGNLFIRPDNKIVLLDFGITGRLSDERRQAFLRLLIGATTNDLKGQLAALRDLGALPADVDLDEVITTLGLDKAPIDPTTLTGEELVAGLKETIKALLAIGAKLPKEVMLFIKNLIFLDGAIGALAPDLNLLEEITKIFTHFATRHGEQIAAEVGLDTSVAIDIDIEAIKGAVGLDDQVQSFTYRDLQNSRKIIRDRTREVRGSDRR